MDRIEEMFFAAKDMTAGQLNAIVKKLGGKEGALSFLRGELVVSKPKPPKLTVWRTVVIGSYMRTSDYREELDKIRCYVDVEVRRTIRELPFLAKKVEIDLVVLSVEELGFPGAAYYKDILKKAEQFGLALCPAEVGPALRLAYLCQPEGESLVVAMPPSHDAGCSWVLKVGRKNNSLTLGPASPLPYEQYDEQSLFVFQRPQERV